MSASTATSTTYGTRLTSEELAQRLKIDELPGNTGTEKLRSYVQANWQTIQIQAQPLFDSLAELNKNIATLGLEKRLEVQLTAFPLWPTSNSGDEKLTAQIIKSAKFFNKHPISNRLLFAAVGVFYLALNVAMVAALAFLSYTIAISPVFPLKQTASLILACAAFTKVIRNAYIIPNLFWLALSPSTGQVLEERSKLASQEILRQKQHLFNQLKPFHLQLFTIDFLDKIASREDGPYQLQQVASLFFDRRSVATEAGSLWSLSCVDAASKAKNFLADFRALHAQLKNRDVSIR